MVQALEPMKSAWRCVRPLERQPAPECAGPQPRSSQPISTPRSKPRFRRRSRPPASTARCATAPTATGVTVEPYIPAGHPRIRPRGAARASTSGRCPRRTCPSMPSARTRRGACRVSRSCRRCAPEHGAPASIERAAQCQGAVQASGLQCRAQSRRRAGPATAARTGRRNPGRRRCRGRAAIEQGAAGPPARPAEEGAQGGFDPHGRASVQHPTKEHLEIPAFLRKHG